jgi:protein-S-isoprenylcysteine O-methyltransferase Ste14
MGGAVFVASLAFAAASYFLHWSVATGNGWPAVAVNALLITAFAAHHSLFAREDVKRWLARSIPERLLRSVYVWTASLLFLGSCAAWRPIGHEIFHAAGWRSWLHAAVQLSGIWMSAAAVRGLHPLELAGIRRPSPVEGVQLHGPYHVVRHPLYLGWMLIVFGTAHMTGDRLAFAVLTTLYLVIAIPWEERSLVRTMGDDYRRYQQLVRWRVIPFIY